jgi:inhibitor of KinA
MSEDTRVAVEDAEAGYRLVMAGDSVVVAEFEPRIDPTINARVVATAQALRAEPVSGIRDVVPTYAAVAVYFDPFLVSASAVRARLRAATRRSPESRQVPQEVTRIPVHYGGSDGPDLPAVARFAGLSEAEVVRLHAGRIYRVYMLGFLPGFAYMGSVAPQIAAPRLASPRMRVPAGAVGIAGEQTGIYPLEAPGGWQLIGRTPLVMFDWRRERPALLQAGDFVQFEAIASSGE